MEFTLQVRHEPGKHQYNYPASMTPTLTVKSPSPQVKPLYLRLCYRFGPVWVRAGQAALARLILRQQCASTSGSLEETGDAVSCAGGDRRRRDDGGGAALSPGRGGLDRFAADREGRADLGLDLARGRPVPELHRRLQHGQGPPLRQHALPEAGGDDRPVHLVARLRRHPLRDHPRGARLVQARRRHGQADRLPHGDHRPQRDQAHQPLRRRGRGDRRRLDAGRRPRGSGRLLQCAGQGRARHGRLHRAPQPGPRHQPRPTASGRSRPSRAG